jgi:hypothetical protein
LRDAISAGGDGLVLVNRIASGERLALALRARSRDLIAHRGGSANARVLG